MQRYTFEVIEVTCRKCGTFHAALRKATVDAKLDAGRALCCPRCRVRLHPDRWRTLGTAETETPEGALREILGGKP